MNVSHIVCNIKKHDQDHKAGIAQYWETIVFDVKYLLSIEIIVF